MRIPVVAMVVLLLGTGSVGWAQPGARRGPEPTLARDPGKGFLDYFNAHDATGLSRLWTADASYTSGDVHLSGRDKIQQAYTDLFKADPKCVLSIRSMTILKAEPSEMQVTGLLDEKHTDGSVTASQFTSTLVKQDDSWLFSKVVEKVLPSSSQASVQLAKLDWLVGNWSDAKDKTQVFNTVTWVEGGNFLRRSYSQVVNGQVVRQGMQIIGWDAETKSFRCWLFDADGTFGEGTISSDDQQSWVMKLAVTLPNGGHASQKQVFQPLSKDQIQIETFDREVDGASLPNGVPVTLVRQMQTSSPMKK
ncbi:protein of unknown function [Planctomicrobium piriforme]|uniref:DUF4440 domain-containing protein n=2 Tax=Planctomicrobium piriforme TaxID=1576369 RepID=A0A1I3THE3_9PLAN|nr:protein of unknown function [Planctomicrobium piriforme]